MSVRYPSRFGMHGLAVLIKLDLQRLLILVAVRAMTSPLRLERCRAVCAVRLDGDVSQPFRDAQIWLLHCPTFKSKA